MKIYQLKEEFFLPVSINVAWDFFSRPENLAKIAPESLKFTVTSEYQPGMFEGMIIHYSVRPLLNIPILWVTEITHVNQPYYFVDDQRIGPYRLWVHRHHFKEVEGGVVISDFVSYVLPFGILGRFAHAIFVKRKIQQIFIYRKNVMLNLFGTSK